MPKNIARSLPTFKKVQLTHKSSAQLTQLSQSQRNCLKEFVQKIQKSALDLYNFERPDGLRFLKTCDTAITYNVIKEDTFVFIDIENR